MIALLLVGFDPINGDEPLPTNEKEAETTVANTVYFYTNQYPDKVSCTEIYEEKMYLYECWVEKYGYDNQLVFILKG